MHGHFRTFASCFDHLAENILAPYSPDIFAMAWGDSMGDHLHPPNTQNPTTHPGYLLESPPVSGDYLAWAMSSLRAIDLHLDHYYLHDARFQGMLDRFMPWNHPWEHHRPKGTISLNWTRYAVHRMRQEHQRRTGTTYDLVISTRWDLMHGSRPDLCAMDHGGLNLPNMYGHDVPGDIWAAGPAWAMDTWADQINGMEELAQAGTLNLGPHEWMRAWLQHREIPWKARDDLNMWLVR